MVASRNSSSNLLGGRKEKARRLSQLAVRVEAAMQVIVVFPHCTRDGGFDKARACLLIHIVMCMKPLAS